MPPDDLVFHGDPVYHVAFAIDATHAPSFGDVVKISAIDRIGQMSVIRRVIG